MQVLLQGTKEDYTTSVVGNASVSWIKKVNTGKRELESHASAVFVCLECIV